MEKKEPPTLLVGMKTGTAIRRVQFSSVQLLSRVRLLATP